jgi:hypothetical protein
MASRHSPFDNSYMLGLIALSCLCLIILAGLWRYSGSILPSADGVPPNEAVLMWLTWAILAGVPLGTLCLWLVLVGRQSKKP